MRRSLWVSKVFLLLLFLHIGAVFQGCMVTKDRTEFGPFYYRRELPRPEATESAVLWPFFQRYESPRISQFALRPLVNVRTEDTGEDLRGNMREVQVLWPLFLYRKTEGPRRLKIRLLPVFFHERFQHPDGPEEVDTLLLPFILSGRSDTGENYFALFPLWGTLRGFFAKDRIRFRLFPLYADTLDGEHRSRHFLWPFFSYSKGGGSSSFRCWPLFGWKKKEDWYNKVFVLWPFFSRVQLYLGTDRPTDSWFFLPFYGSQQTPFGKIQYFLYPFFSYQRNERAGNRFREWALPWPFVQITRGDREWRNSFWPFWGRRTKPGYANTFFLYPIGRQLVYGDPEELTRRLYVLPLYWDWRVTEDGEFSKGRVKGWPFFDSFRQGEEARQVRTLSPLWFWRPDGGFERNYSDFWKLYEYRHWQDGLKERKILWYRWFSIAPGETDKLRATIEPLEDPSTSPEDPGSESPWDAGALSDNPLFEGPSSPAEKLGLQ
ncbi:MAG: hypothetical protein ACWGSD_00870 [Thermodesulfobacteriota bacterium]